MGLHLFSLPYMKNDWIILNHQRLNKETVKNWEMSCVDYAELWTMRCLLLPESRIAG